MCATHSTHLLCCYLSVQCCKVEENASLLVGREGERERGGGGEVRVIGSHLMSII